MDTICSFLSDEEVKQPCIEGPCGFECKRLDEAEPEDTYCTEENCEIFNRDLSCERCNR